MPASANGIPNTVTATTTAVTAPAIAHQCGLTRNPARRPNSTRMGRAATRVDRIQLFSGSYTWVHAMAAPLVVRGGGPTRPSDGIRCGPWPAGQRRLPTPLLG